jgi:hypothetical protein
MPHPCHAMTMPLWKQLLKTTAQRSVGMAWHAGISIGRPETACGRSARVRLLPATTLNSMKVVQKHTNQLNCRTSSSDICGYHADFHGGHDAVREWQGRGMACENWRGMAWQGNGIDVAWAWHSMCELDWRCTKSDSMWKMKGLKSTLRPVLKG